jgi:hypothetical protein
MEIGDVVDPRGLFSREGSVRTSLNSESDPPPDLVLSTMPEERADNRVCILPLIVAFRNRRTEEHRLQPEGVLAVLVALARRTFRESARHHIPPILE